MNTPAHLIFAAAVFARPGAYWPARARNAAALAGGLAPDLSLFLLVGWARWVQAHDWDEIFRQDFNSSLWRGIFAVDQSIPLWAGLTALGVWRRRPLLAIFAGAAMLHLLFDLPLHHSDARAHFQPFTDWVFHSPLSYWNPARHGETVSFIEIAACLALSAWLWLRFRSAAARALIAAGMLAELSPALLWPLILG